MADSIASLRRKWGEAQARIRELEAREPEVVERVVERLVEVPGPERVVEVRVPFEVVRVEYRDVIKEVEVPGTIREVEKLVPFEVQVPMYPPSVQRIEVIKEVYVDNPAHIAMIEQLQEKLCQFISQSDSSQNQHQVGQSSQGVAA